MSYVILHIFLRTILKALPLLKSQRYIRMVVKGCISREG